MFLERVDLGCQELAGDSAQEEAGDYPLHARFFQIGCNTLAANGTVTGAG